MGGESVGPVVVMMYGGVAWLLDGRRLHGPSQSRESRSSRTSHGEELLTLDSYRVSDVRRVLKVVIVCVASHATPALRDAQGKGWKEAYGRMGLWVRLGAALPIREFRGGAPVLWVGMVGRTHLDEPSQNKPKVPRLLLLLLREYAGVQSSMPSAVILRGTVCRVQS